MYQYKNALKSQDTKILPASKQMLPAVLSMQLNKLSTLETEDIFPPIVAWVKYVSYALGII